MTEIDNWLAISSVFERQSPKTWSHHENSYSPHKQPPLVVYETSESDRIHRFFQHDRNDMHIRHLWGGG
jgi:hypothetical protein